MNYQQEATVVAPLDLPVQEGVALGWRDVVELGLDPEPALMSDDEEG